MLLITFTMAAIGCTERQEGATVQLADARFMRVRIAKLIPDINFPNKSV